MPPETSALITDPMAIFAWLATLVAIVFWASGLPRLKGFFEITPPVIYAYFLPTLSTTFGITPAASPLYAWIIRYLLPFSLLLLMVSVDLKAILRLGWIAVVMMLAGTVGIVIGGPIAYLAFGAFLPDEAWKGLAALSGSWIGGTANMVAVAESVGTPQSILGPIIVVDTVVGYSWMGILLLFSGWQNRFDRRIGARTTALEAVGRSLAEIEDRRLPTKLTDLLLLLALGFGGSVLAIAAGNRLPTLGDPTIVSHTTWAVLLVVTVGVLLSFTPMRRLELVGASRVGYAALYLLLTTIGAQADLRAVLAAPFFLAAGALWISVHVIILLIVARLIRAPLFFLATGSMANVGGAASAPVVAGIYNPALAPVGLLLAVAGYVLGTYAGLVCAWLLGMLA
jgi:uncharacterized membrane protein